MSNQKDYDRNLESEIDTNSFLHDDLALSLSGGTFNIKEPLENNISSSHGIHTQDSNERGIDKHLTTIDIENTSGMEISNFCVQETLYAQLDRFLLNDDFFASPYSKNQSCQKDYERTLELEIPILIFMMTWR
ncbi:unnamed protein product [Arabidopsis lyrata]|nr:unnamed protein product [Arabidopsis lyrata]